MTKKIRYKLVDANGYTRWGLSGETLWRPGTVRETDGIGDLCGPGWTHVYTHSILAEFLDPVQGGYGKSARLISVRVSGKSKFDCGLKEGWTVVAYRRKEKRRKVSPVQKVAFGILCSLSVYRDPAFVRWAQDWLSGKNRTGDAARAAENAAWAVKDAAMAAENAAWAASAAASAAEAAAGAVAGAAVWAAEAAAGAVVWAAENAAWAVFWAAENAAGAAKPDLIKLAKQAMKVR